MAQLTVLAICGSLRKNSYNKKLLLAACTNLKEEQCEINNLDLKQIDLPLFDQDIEDATGLPQGAVKLIDAIRTAQAVVIGCPEYNSGITGALKNAIDWASRADKNPFTDKIVLLVGTSPGHFAAIRSAMNTRGILTHLGAFVIPTQVNIPYADKAFDKEGNLTDPMHQKILKAACLKLTETAKSFAKK